MPNIMTLEENEALHAVQDMAELYGWRIPMIWTPSLVKHMFHSHFGREMTDREWDIFAAGEGWNQSIIMAGSLAENEVMLAALEDAFEDADNANVMNQLFGMSEDSNRPVIYIDYGDSENG